MRCDDDDDDDDDDQVLLLFKAVTIREGAGCYLPPIPFLTLPYLSYDLLDYAECVRLS